MADVRSSEARLVDRQGVVMLWDPGGMETPESARFSATHWGGDAKPVASGGRGSAWFIARPGTDWVLRHYRRGGLAARFSADRYLWTGEARVRSIVEFRLLQSLQRLGLPVPVVVAAAYWRLGPTYRAAILMQRIAAVGDLQSVVRRDPEGAPWEAVGRGLAVFHRAGACHADLNAFNLLLDAEGRLHVIDWDRGCLRTPDRSWQVAALDRLERGLLKHRGDASAESIRAGMLRLRDAHEAALA